MAFGVAGGLGQGLLPEGITVVRMYGMVVATVLCAASASGIVLGLRARMKGAAQIVFERSNGLVAAGSLGAIFATALVYFCVLGSPYVPFVTVLLTLPGIAAGVLLAVYILRAKVVQLPAR